MIATKNISKKRKLYWGDPPRKKKRRIRMETDKGGNWTELSAKRNILRLEHGQGGEKRHY